MIPWPEKIETEYQSWINVRELFHPLDFKYFARFVWACVEDPNGAPDEVEFRARLAVSWCPMNKDTLIRR